MAFFIKQNDTSPALKATLKDGLDVAVDLRKDSTTFGKHFKHLLSGENKKQLYIPKGFAHGFSVLSQHATVLYKCDAIYHPVSESGIRFDDQDYIFDFLHRSHGGFKWGFEWHFQHAKTDTANFHYIFPVVKLLYSVTFIKTMNRI